ncbi:hypothetical protein F4808DRAFT_420799 [Astrocystis sublimbata]|nr:hypothetical protein F4808DRAFT_420799 [Astrocystis sublimbata]
MEPSSKTYNTRPSSQRNSPFNLIQDGLANSNSRGFLAAHGRTMLEYEQNSPEDCCNYCSGVSPSYSYCGVEFGYQCFCGSTLKGARLAGDEHCSSSCAGSSGQQCGAAYFMNLYSATVFAEATTGAAPTSSTSAVLPTPTSTVSSTSSSSPSSGGLSAGAIAGIAIGALVGLGCVVLMLSCKWVRRRRRAGVLSVHPESNGAAGMQHYTPAHHHDSKTVEMHAQPVIRAELD